MIRRLVQLALAIAAVAAFGARPAYAGNIALTGHDDDFHCDLDSPALSIANDACQQISQLTGFVRNGSSLPVLVFDPVGTGSSSDPAGELIKSLTALGIPHVDITTSAAVNAALFDNTLYSAFVVASDTSCGGCDNTAAMTGALATNTSAINNFFNNGGGIFALSGAGRASTGFYSFLPVAAVGAGSPPSSGYGSTGACGVTVTAVNGDATHNFFSEPGTGGVSSLFCVAERGHGPTGAVGAGSAVTLVLGTGTIVTDVITTASAVPEPATLSLLGLGLLGAYRRRRRS